jgi:UDPglucose 6-dehydrogenase
METIGVIGVGKLGLCLALILERAGYKVKCFDKCKPLANAIKSKTLQSIEPHVEQYLKAATNVEVVDSLAEIYKLKMIFVVVATPSLASGAYNHSAVDEVVADFVKLNEAAPDMSEKVFVVSCTTMPQYCDSVQERLAAFNYKVCYNPEFIAQGDIINGQLNPDMVLIGYSDANACEKLKEVHSKFTLNNPRMHCMSLTEAEITKISLNCFLTTKISFANLIGDIVHKAGGNPEAVLSAVGSDTRVGHKFLKWGHGFGGPCLPRDNRALCHFAESIGMRNTIGETTDAFNRAHVDNLVEYIVGKNVGKLPYLFNSVVYKRHTHILEESQKLELALRLAKKGVPVHIVDESKIVQELENKYANLFTYSTVLPENSTQYFDVNKYVL